MATNVKAIPEGYRTVTPYLIVRGTAQALEFYQKAFGAQVAMRMAGPDGKSILHAEIKIGDSMVFLTDEGPGMTGRSPQTLGGTTGSIYLYVEDADACFARAVAAGAKAQMPPTDMFWGDRFGMVVDPFGHEWGIATRKEDLSPDEMGRRAQAFYAQMAKQVQHRLELTGPGVGLLKEILDGYLSELRGEISDTENYDFRQTLKQKEVFVKDLLQKLQG